MSNQDNFIKISSKKINDAEVWLYGSGSDTKMDMQLQNITNYSVEEKIIIFLSVYCGMCSSELFL